METIQGFFGASWPLVWTLVKIIVIIVPLLLCVAYLTLLERRVIGAIQNRIGPNRVGPYGLLQPVIDGIKAVVKEVIIPTGADKTLYLMAPILAFAPALLAWAVIPFTDHWVLANIDASLLYILAISSMGVYGIILAGWASNSKYSFLGGLRSAAQMISYEIAMGFSLICVLMVSNSLNLTDIVHAQQKGFFAEHGVGFLSWNWLPMLPMFVVYLISCVAETNRAPFDMAECESEIVAGFQTEYSGISFAMFFLAEYANMILVSTLAAILFLGGWSAPIGGPHLDGFFWLAFKVFCLLNGFLWIRATFPRYRYDQIMRLGWKVFVPICLVWLVVVGIWMMTPLSVWK